MATDSARIKMLMCEVPIFDMLESADTARLAAFLEYRSVPAGTILAREGEEGHSVFFIVSGKVAIQKEGMDGKVSTIGQLGKGASVGEISLVVDHPRRIATVTAIGTVEFLVLTRDNFELVIAKAPSIAIRILRNIAATLSQRLTQLSGRVADLA